VVPLAMTLNQDFKNTLNISETIRARHIVITVTDRQSYWILPSSVIWINFRLLFWSWTFKVI